MEKCRWRKVDAAIKMEKGGWRKVFEKGRWKKIDGGWQMEKLICLVNRVDTN